MLPTLTTLWAAALLAIAAFPCQAAEPPPQRIPPAPQPPSAFAVTPVGGAPNHGYVTLPSRPEVGQGFLLVDRADPVASVIGFAGGNGVLVPGGAWGRQSIGPKGIKAFEATGLLMRTREGLAQAGFLVALLDTPSDPGTLDGFRTTPAHAQDVRAVIAWLRRRAKVPVWLVGGSRGSVSVASVAATLQDGAGPDGLVLLSSLLRPAGGPEPATVFSVALGAIRVPVLIVHHEQDACPATPFGDVPALVSALRGGRNPVVHSLNGGGPISGNPCGARHHHGFAGQEEAVVDAIAKFIRARSTPGQR